MMGPFAKMTLLRAAWTGMRPYSKKKSITQTTADHVRIRWHFFLNDEKWLCQDHDLRSKQIVGNDWTDPEKLSLRAYPCVECLHALIDSGDAPYEGTGTKIYGKAPPTDGSPDPPAFNLGEVKLGGSQGTLPPKSTRVRHDIDMLATGRSFRWITGCDCAKKLLSTYQCMAHRTHHFEKIKVQARRMQEWRVSLSRDNSKTCYLCRKK